MSFAPASVPLLREQRCIRVRKFLYSQEDAMGAGYIDCAIALMASYHIHKIGPDVWNRFRDSSRVLELMSEGMIWHSRWLAFNENLNEQSVPAADEICDVPGCPTQCTEQGYSGTLADDSFGTPIVTALNKLKDDIGPDEVFTYILSIKDITTLLVVTENDFFIFDSHPRNLKGLPNKEATAKQKVKEAKNTDTELAEANLAPGAILVLLPNSEVLRRYLDILYDFKAYAGTLYTLQLVQPLHPVTREPAPEPPPSPTPVDNGEGITAKASSYANSLFGRFRKYDSRHALTLAADGIESTANRLGLSAPLLSAVEGMELFLDPQTEYQLSKEELRKDTVPY